MEEVYNGESWIMEEVYSEVYVGSWRKFITERVGSWMKYILACMLAQGGSISWMELDHQGSIF